jgi:hypothetical protein
VSDERPTWKRVRAGFWQYGGEVEIKRNGPWWEVWVFPTPDASVASYAGRGFGLAAGKRLGEVSYLAALAGLVA